MIDIRTESKGYVAHGVSACAGCGMELIIRNVLDVLGQDTTLVIPPGCSALFCGFGCETGIKVSAFQGNLENSAAIATGIRAGYAVQGNDHTHVVAFAGDGATLDIGLQSLSGMMERGEDVLYICYDNEEMCIRDSGDCMCFPCRDDSCNGSCPFQNTGSQDAEQPGEGRGS